MKRFQLPDRPPVPLGQWEEVDPYGDAYRLKLGRRLTIGLTLTALVFAGLMIIGDRQVRMAVGGLLGLNVAFLVGVVAGWVRITRRLTRGRGLVAGDPYRPEGIDPDEAMTNQDDPTEERGENIARPSP